MGWPLLYAAAARTLRSEQWTLVSAGGDIHVRNQGHEVSDSGDISVSHPISTSCWPA